MHVDLSVSECFFEFQYGNRKYGINNNQCGSKNSGEGLEGVTSCKCAFSRKGTLPRKRESGLVA
jgi:hypothetical protein